MIKLQSKTSRRKILSRGAPYWQRIGKGRALGYRRREGSEVGTWMARRFDASAPHPMRHSVLGIADDARDADGTTILSHADAARRAQEWFDRTDREALDYEPRSGKYTVADALEDYFQDREQKGVKGVARMRSAAKAHILPSLGNLAVQKVSRRRLEQWLDATGNSAKRLRTPAGKVQRFAPAPRTEEERGQRRDTANRILTVLKAALNQTVKRHEVNPEFAHVWREVRPFHNVGRPRIHFLGRPEQQKLVSACDEGFGDLVRAALFTGGRFSELASLTVVDFDPINRTVLILRSKSSKSRHVRLTPDACEFFSELCTARDGGELMLTRLGASGERVKWQNRPAQRLLKTACKSAKIAPVTFHELRHTTASTWIRQGVPLQVVSEQLGHSSIAITVKHYAHIAKDWKAAIFDALPAIGFEKSGRASRREKQIVQWLPGHALPFHHMRQNFSNTLWKR